MKQVTIQAQTKAAVMKYMRLGKEVALEGDVTFVDRFGDFATYGASMDTLPPNFLRNVPARTYAGGHAGQCAQAQLQNQDKEPV